MKQPFKTYFAMSETQEASASSMRMWWCILLAVALAFGLVGAPAFQAAFAEEPASAEKSEAEATGVEDGEGLPRASCSSASPNRTPKEEVVYARLKNNGAVENIFVVNTLNPEKPGKVTDHGLYESVQSLTEADELEYADGVITAQITGESLSYQGNMIAKDLPWDIFVGYTLDGKTVSGADVAGKSGKLEINIKTTKNTQVDAGFFENYLLQITLSFGSEVAREIKTEDGQIALAGSDTQVTFTGMPDKTGSFVATAQVTDFEMPGITFAAVPFSMMIDSPDAGEFTASLNELSDGIGQLNSGASALATGMQSFAGGVGKFTGGVTEIVDGVSGIASGAGSLAENSAAIKEGLDGLASKGDGIIAGSSDINQGVGAINASVPALSGLLTDPDFQVYLATKTTEEQQAITAALGTLSAVTPLPYTDFHTGLQAYVGGTSALAQQYAPFNSGVADLASGASALSSGADQLASNSSELASGVNELATGAKELSGGTDSLYTETQGMPDAVQEEIDKMLADYDKSDYQPVSFTSTKNTAVTLTQFVFTTEPIQLPEQESEKAPKTESTLLSRFLALFGVEM